MRSVAIFEAELPCPVPHAVLLKYSGLGLFVSETGF